MKRVDLNSGRIRWKMLLLGRCCCLPDLHGTLCGLTNNMHSCIMMSQLSYSITFPMNACTKCLFTYAMPWFGIVKCNTSHLSTLHSFCHFLVHLSNSSRSQCKLRYSSIAIDFWHLDTSFRNNQSSWHFLISIWFDQLYSHALCQSFQICCDRCRLKIVFLQTLQQVFSIVRHQVMAVYGNYLLTTWSFLKVLITKSSLLQTKWLLVC